MINKKMYIIEMLALMDEYSAKEDAYNGNYRHKIDPNGFESIPVTKESEEMYRDFCKKSQLLAEKYKKKKE